MDEVLKLALIDETAPEPAPEAVQPQTATV
jgi:hypothetical protein